MQLPGTERHPQGRGQKNALITSNTKLQIDVSWISRLTLPHSQNAYLLNKKRKSLGAELFENRVHGDRASLNIPDNTLWQPGKERLS